MDDLEKFKLSHQNELKRKENMHLEIFAANPNLTVFEVSIIYEAG